MTTERYEEITHNGRVVGRRLVVDGMEPSTPVTHTPLMTRYTFLTRLTLDEHVAIEDAMPTSTLLRVAKQRFDAASEVDVSLPETQQFVGLLAQLGLIAPERVAELLAEKPLTERGAIHPETFEATP